MGRVFVLVFLLVTSNSLVANPEYLGTVPRWLFEDMKKHDCSPVKNYYYGADVRRPPFTFFGENDWNFTYICEKNNYLDNRYMLVISISKKTNHEFASCMNKIDLHITSPTGFYYSKEKINSVWFQVGKELNKGEELQISDNYPMLVLEEEVATKFICIEGVWYFQ